MPSPSAHPLIRKIQRTIDLTQYERAAVSALPTRLAEYRAGHDILREGDRASRVALVVSGFVGTYKSTEDGRRQTTALSIAGDMPDLQSLHFTLFDSDVQAISDSTVALIDHAPIKLLCAEFPRLAALLWRSTLVDASIGREWMLCLGQRKAPARLAHLFCELLLRMQASGLAKGLTCMLPLTQHSLGEACGMSNVHMNRTLQSLRRENVMAFDAGRLTIYDWPGLVSIAGFDAGYLHLEAS